MKTIYIDSQNELNKRKCKRIAKKIYKIGKKEEVVVAISENLDKNKDLFDEISKYEIKILDGRWLFKFLICEIVNYIVQNNNIKIETQTIAILINHMDDIILQQLLEIAKNVKSLKIVTNSLDKFSYIEEKLYEDYGIAIQITNNKKKSLLNTDIIINFDFDEKGINEYNINSVATLINLQGKIEIYTSEFKGIIIDYYKIEYNKENFCNYEEKSNFDNNVLYESYIYRKDTFLNIQKQLRQDDVRLIELTKSNGKEYH